MNLHRAGREGVVVRAVAYDDDLVEGLRTCTMRPRFGKAGRSGTTARVSKILKRFMALTASVPSTLALTLRASLSDF